MGKNKYIGHMKTFLLELKPKSGLLTELQSDTIYGHFCWRLKEKLGVEKLTKFISLYKIGKPIFLLSDGLLKFENEIFFPRPYIFNEPIVKEKKKDKILEFVKRKNNKESSYISLTQLNAFLNNPVEETVSAWQEKKPQPKIEEQLRVSVQIDRNSFAASEGKLFSYNPKFLGEDLSYIVLFKIPNEELFKEFECEQIIKDVFALGFGKKKSSGYGHFEEDIQFIPFNEIIEPENGNAFIVLGNYLASNDDEASPIGYDINTKYGKFGEELAQSNNPFKNPIVFLTTGSCFNTSNNKKSYYGRITSEGEISDYHRNSIQFGCPFFLRFNKSK